MTKQKLLLIFMVFCSSLWAQDEMFKSLFIYNFTKNIEWPAEYKSGDFIITVVGNSAIVPELDKIAKLKKVGNQAIVVKKVNDASEIGKTHLVYITPSKSATIGVVMSSTSGKPVVIVGDKPGLALQGAGLNFIKVDGKQKFEINKSNLTNSNLKVNSYLETLGITVN